MPNISIILPVYNAVDFIDTAITGLLKQTYSDFELIVVNDGSTDRTDEVLEKIKDPRVRIITQKNTGLVGALQTGIAAAKAPLIARHDADDRSMPDRLQKQVDFMMAHPDIILLGSSMQTMDMSGQVINSHYVLLEDPELKQELLVRSPFAHGSVVFRRDAYEAAGGYLKGDWPAEDYGLWVRMACRGKFSNLDEPLYIYRENAKGISTLNQAEQRKRSKEAKQAAWKIRKTLLPKNLNIEKYHVKPMGEFRIARITCNLLSTIRSAATRGDIFFVTKTAWLIFYSKPLRRKCARLLLMKLGLRNDF